MASDSISFTVSFRGKSHRLSLSPNTTLTALHAQLEELTEVPPSLQKLLYKGKRQTEGDDDAGTLLQAGIKDGMKIQMLGTTTKDLDGMKAIENENQRRERIMRERALKAPVKVSIAYSSCKYLSADTINISYGQLVQALYRPFRRLLQLHYNTAFMMSSPYPIFPIPTLH
jgi:hypothetical protein